MLVTLLKKFQKTQNYLIFIQNLTRKKEPQKAKDLKSFA